VDIVNELVADGYREGAIDELIKLMRDAKLLWSQQGPYSQVWIT
jgi:hypothetical protein